MEDTYTNAIVALLKATNDFIVGAIQSTDVNEIPFEELSYNVIMALMDIRDADSDLFNELDSGIDGMLYSHASAHEFELMLSRVNEDDSKPQYIECDEQFSRNLMDQLAKDLRPTFDDEVPF